MIALFADVKLDGLLAGLGGGFAGPGIVRILRYRHWNKPEHREEYRERMEMEQINLHDELNVKLRDRAGKYAYFLNLIVSCAGILILRAIDDMEILTVDSWIFKCLAGYLVFQAVSYFVIFYKLLDKYTD
ncbi:MAG: hypothetical protein J6S45_07525 [Firmicutes bacterium]|nr:hypothetical protein [Bacillota bacterium]